MSEGRLFEILEEALAARMIEELPQSVDRYQFTQALIQDTQNHLQKILTFQVCQFLGVVL